MILFSKRAQRDIDETLVAEEYLLALHETIRLIERFRGIGHPVAGNLKIRVWRHEEYKIYYFGEGADLLIVRVLHERRRVPKRIR